MSKYSPADRPKVGDFVGELKNLHVSNIRATVPPSSTGKGINQPCVALVGMPGHLIENVTFYNFNLIMPGGGTPEQANRNDIPELISEKDILKRTISKENCQLLSSISGISVG